LLQRFLFLPIWRWECAIHYVLEQPPKHISYLMISFFLNLFDTSGFPARWNCGQWSAGHGWLHIISDIAIFGAYAAIPLALAYFARQRKDVPFTPVLWLFVAFIASCGLTHLIEAMIFWHPWYRFSGLMKAVTAVVSWMTVIALLKVLPSALALPGLAKLNHQLSEEIAERTRVEEALRENEARNRFMITLGDAIRPQSDPTEVQAAATRLLGELLGADRVVYFEVRGEDYVVERDYTHGVPSIVGHYPVASFGPEMLATYSAGLTSSGADVDALSSITAEEKAVYAAVQIRAYVGVPLVKDGAFVAGLAVHMATPRVWTSTEIAMIEDTAERTWAAVEQVRTEAALRESEERRRLALDAAELGAWHIDLVTLAMTTDERFRLLFTGNIEEINYEQAFAAIHPDDREKNREAVEAATRHSNPAPYAQEYRVIHPNGTVRWLFSKGRANYDSDEPGRLVSFDGTVADISARKFIEEERERLVAQLRDADRRKDEFLATLAHELRNPLAPIRNGLEIMRLAGTEGALERTRSMMDRQLTQLVRLVDDLLDVSRVTSGKLELRREQVTLRTVIDSAVETSRPAFDLAGHELEIVVPDEPILLDGDSTRLTQIISNLLSNSAKYTHRGGRVRLEVRCEDSMAVLSVADNGSGIPPEMLGRIFEMFIQVDRALEKTTGGLGIGLSLVKGLVEMHGGSIEARSEGEGRGSEFIVRLPLAASSGPKLGMAEVEKSVGSSEDRILVADDNVDSAESLGMVLELLGNQVSIANDGLQALEMAERLLPEVILLDIGMPKMNGYEVCRRIREQPWGKNTILIAMTGWGQDEDKRLSQEAGFDHHLVKPVDPAALMKLLAGIKAEKAR
jgi:PAS domain S-box-containing protein